MLRRIAIALVITALYSGAVFTTNGCGGGYSAPSPVPPSGITAVKGVVTDAQTGAPLEHVRIALQGRLRNTDAAGEYFFPDIEPRRSILTAAREGYQVYEIELTLRSGDLNQHNFVMRAR
jgi:hypothetical protein